MFIRATSNRRINLDHVTEFWLENGSWFARWRDSACIKIGEGEYPEKLIDVATSVIVPAAAGEILHRFSLNEDDHSLVHEKERIIAWVIDASFPMPITPNGAVNCGWENLAQQIIAIQHPDGRYDDIFNRVFEHEGAVREELEKHALKALTLTRNETMSPR